MAIHLDRLQEEFDNISEIIKKAIIVEVLRRSAESGSMPDESELAYAAANRNNSRRLDLFDDLYKIPVQHLRYIRECPKLKEVMALAIGLLVFAFWKKGDGFGANQLKKQGEYMGVLEIDVEPDFTNLKAFLQKANMLDAETNSKIANLKSQHPVFTKIASDFAHIRQPVYEGVKSCLVPLVAILSCLGALTLVCIIFFRSL